MNPQDHWNLIASDPRLKSDSLRGWNFSPDPGPVRRLWIALSLAGAALIVGGFILMRFGL